MCGIAGGWWLNSDEIDERLSNALRKIKHRGPDDDGYKIFSTDESYVGLGHTRLSIIDLSSAGHQPMSSLDKRWFIVFNGEIYNYRELRSELIEIGHVFQGDSDTEVLLAAWIEWGAECLPRLVGMFSFVIFDNTEDRLIFARDAFGIKPLFYSIKNDALTFASELTALMELSSGDIALNLQRVYDYLAYGDYDTQNSNFIDGIDQLAPGHWMQFDCKNKKLSNPIRWWNPSVIKTSDLSFNDAAERLRELFLQSIRYHLRSDVPLGAALSGGIDSSAVVCAIRHLEPDAPIHTFSFLAKGSPVSEEKWINLINSYVNAIPHEVLVSPFELAEDLNDMIIAQGEPFGSTSIYAQYRVFKLAKECGVTVTLDGQGADELLAGYRGYPGKRIRSLLERFDFFKAINFLHNWSKWPDRPLSIGIKAAIAEFSGGFLFQILKKLNGEENKPKWLNIRYLEDAGVKMNFPHSEPIKSVKGRRLTSELLYASTRNGLPGLLRHADRNSMRFSVESRVPFLTTEMAEFLFSLPEEYLISQEGETKSIFKAAMRGIVPDEVLNRRDKIGFATPEKDWLIQLAPQARKWLEKSEELPWLNKQAMLNDFDAIIQGRIVFSWQAWRFINFTRWYSLVFLPMSR